MYDLDWTVVRDFTISFAYVSTMDADQIMRYNHVGGFVAGYDPEIINAIKDTLAVYLQPSISASPLSIDFGDVYIGDSSTSSVWVVNSGTGILDVTSASGLEPPFSDNFTPDLVYALDDTMWINITFAPEGEGTFSDELVISSDAGEMTINVSGEGLSPISLSAELLAFGEVAVDSSARDSVWILNIGVQALSIDNATLQVGSPFSVDFQPTSINPGDSASIAVIFAPAQTGVFIDTMEISASGGEVKVGLSGEGIELWAQDFRKDLPSDFALHPNYPNPFNPSTIIDFDLARTVQVSLDVYDVNGAKVAALCSGELGQGRHSFTFSGEYLPSGLYFCRLQAGDFTAVRKLILVK